MVNVYLLRVSTDETPGMAETANISWFHPDSIPIHEMPVSVAERLRALAPRLAESN